MEPRTSPVEIYNVFRDALLQNGEDGMDSRNFYCSVPVIGEDYSGQMQLSDYWAFNAVEFNGPNRMPEHNRLLSLGRTILNVQVKFEGRDVMPCYITARPDDVRGGSMVRMATGDALSVSGNEPQVIALNILERTSERLIEPVQDSQLMHVYSALLQSLR